MHKKSLLGIFDSGVGGFSVLDEVRKVTDADIVYYGDCAHAPYGNRTSEDIVLLIKSTLVHLRSLGVTHFVSACNSMSVNTTEVLLQEMAIKRSQYIDMIDGVREILWSDGANVLIIGTTATIRSLVYQTILSDKLVAYKTFSPITLAGAIEESDTEGIAKSIKEIILFAKEMHATHVLYACTHYPLVDIEFKQKAAELGWAGMFVNPAVYVAQLVSEWKLHGDKQIQFEASLKTRVFKKYSMDRA
jgi:glutamate racemase